MSSTPMDDDLVAAGRVVRLETTGRTSGETRTVAVGFVPDTEGELLIAANDPDTDWALNLLAEPRCVVTLGHDRQPATAEPLEGPEHAAAVRELILRYGTPSERLGRGPAFRLRRLGPPAANERSR